MRPPLNLLQIDKVILHQIPHQLRAKSEEPIYSEIESPIDDDLRILFRERINASASSAAYDVRLDDASTSPIPSMIYEYLHGTPMGFVELSKVMARRLLDTQTGVNSGGILAVIGCHFGKAQGVCILKLEREEGARLEQSAVGGMRTFSIQILRDIMFTQKTRLYKMGLFCATSRAKPDDVIGIVCDEQRGYHPRLEVASFFLHKFLGCQLRVEPSVATKRFFEETERFINKAIDDPVRKAECMNHLLSEVTSQQPQISAQKFAAAYLRPEERQPYLYFVGQQVATETFPKDIALIASRIKKMVFEFASGIQIVGHQDAIDEKLTLTSLGNGLTKAELVDEFKEIRTRK